MKCLPGAHKKNDGYFSRSIPSYLTEIDGICCEVHELFEQRHQTENWFAVDLLLREFINNAIIHGHQLDGCKQVEVSVRIGRKWIQLKIADQGPGFNWRHRGREIPDLSAVSGRGLCIAACYCQKIQHNHTGSSITLWLKIRK